MLPDLDPAPAPPTVTGIRTEPQRSWHGAAIVLLVVTLVAVLGAVAAAVLVSRDPGAETPAVTASSAEGRTIRYLVPPGTGARIDAGEEVEIIPPELTMKVGDTLVIINDDDREHSVAGYQVRSGDTLRVSYPRPGLYMNSCSVNTSDLVYIYVVE